jgi:hypothetical protein
MGAPDKTARFKPRQIAADARRGRTRDGQQFLYRRRSGAKKKLYDLLGTAGYRFGHGGARRSPLEKIAFGLALESYISVAVSIDLFH